MRVSPNGPIPCLFPGPGPAVLLLPAVAADAVTAGDNQTNGIYEELKWRGVSSHHLEK